MDDDVDDETLDICFGQFSKLQNKNKKYAEKIDTNKIVESLLVGARCPLRAELERVKIRTRKLCVPEHSAYFDV